VAGLNVDDAQAAHGQSDVLLDKKAVVIGPAVCDLLVHLRQCVAANPLSPVTLDNATNSTHD